MYHVGLLACKHEVYKYLYKYLILNGYTPEALHNTCNLAIILQYFNILTYELFCKRNEIPLSAHFIYLNSGSYWPEDG